MSVDEAKLTQYALGILDEGEHKAVQKKVAESPNLQQQLESIRNTFQLISLAEKPLCSGDRLRNMVLNSTRDKTRFEGFVDRFADLFDLDNLTAQSLLEKIDHSADSDWNLTLFSGVKVMKFNGGPMLASATCGIVQVKPGKLFPAHQHQGDEMILVLQGVARDDNDKVFKAGDRFLFSKGSCHSFHIISDETFIFAVVLHKKNKWLLFKTLFDQLSIKKN